MTRWILNPLTSWFCGSSACDVGVARQISGCESMIAATGNQAPWILNQHFPAEFHVFWMDDENKKRLFFRHQSEVCVLGVRMEFEEGVRGLRPSESSSTRGKLHPAASAVTSAIACFPEKSLCRLTRGHTRVRFPL